MKSLKVASVILALVTVALFIACESTPSAPDVDVARPMTGSASPESGTTAPLYGRGNGALGTVYVSSQGLHYDTFVTAEELPPKGRFQELVNGVTEFGPGDRGYLGGRWKAPDGMGGYRYFLCPLLPPGRESP